MNQINDVLGILDPAHLLGQDLVFQNGPFATYNPGKPQLAIFTGTTRLKKNCKENKKGELHSSP